MGAVKNISNVVVRMIEAAKQEKPLKLDMDFDEALKRFTSVDKKELEKELDKHKEEKEKK